VPRFANIGAQGGSGPSGLNKMAYSFPSRGSEGSDEAVSVFGELIYRAQVSVEYSVERR
jgi:hypothetical protein